MIALWIICGLVVAALIVAAWLWLWEKIQMAWLKAHPLSASAALGLKNAHDGRLFYQIRQAARRGSLSIKFDGTVEGDVGVRLKDLGYSVTVDYPSSGIITTVSWKEVKETAWPGRVP